MDAPLFFFAPLPENHPGFADKSNGQDGSVSVSGSAGSAFQGEAAALGRSVQPVMV